MNVMLSQNGENFIVELDIDEGINLHSILEFVQRHALTHDKYTPEELELASRLAVEFERYLNDEMYEVIG